MRHNYSRNAYHGSHKNISVPEHCGGILVGKGDDNVKYPKQIMRLSELANMGFPEEFLLRAYRSKGQAFAWKMNPARRNSPIIFETAGFEAYRLSQIRLQTGGSR